MSQEWQRYYDAAGDEPRETLLRALDLFGGSTGFAVDLGCGTGRDTAELLRRGWRVLSIDGEREAIERLVARLGEDEALETRVASFDRAEWPVADLVNSSYALPFCPPALFPTVWQRIVDSLPPGGRFCGQLFGDRDSWVETRDITFMPRSRAEELLSAFDRELFEEVEEDGSTVVGDPKHWHLFNVVARKR
jgi:SAM-dependent methyltransferase